jgi:hypothetical protein
MNNMFLLTLRPNTLIRRLSPADLLGLLALVLNHTNAAPEPSTSENAAQVRNINQGGNFGEPITKKKRNILRVGFLNIGGFPSNKNSTKNDLLKQSLLAYQFDAFGMAELNTDWRKIEEHNRLHSILSGWWETLHK